MTRNRVLKVSAVTGMRFLLDESKPVPNSYDPPPDHFVRSGDLLLVAYVDAAPANLLLPDKLWRFVWRQPILTDSFFVWALFQTSPVRYEIGRRATGTSGSMKNISQERVLGIRTVVPPIQLQHDFAQQVVVIERLKEGPVTQSPSSTPSSPLSSTGRYPAICSLKQAPSLIYSQPLT